MRRPESTGTGSHRFHAVGVGEISTSPGPSAVFMAASNAIGQWLHEYQIGALTSHPLTPAPGEIQPPVPSRPNCSHTPNTERSDPRRQPLSGYPLLVLSISQEIGGPIQCLRKGNGPCLAVKGDNRYHAIMGGKKCFAVCPSDMAVALAALEAKIIISSSNGERRVDVTDFYHPLKNDLAKHEMVREIEIPVPRVPSRQTFLTVSLKITAVGGKYLTVGLKDLAFSLVIR